METKYNTCARKSKCRLNTTNCLGATSFIGEVHEYRNKVVIMYDYVFCNTCKNANGSSEHDIGKQIGFITLKKRKFLSSTTNSCRFILRVNFGYLLHPLFRTILMKRKSKFYWYFVTLV